MSATRVFIEAGLILLLLVAPAWADTSIKPNGAKSVAVSKMEPLPVNQIIVKYKPSANLAAAAAAGATAQMQRMSAAAGVALGYHRPMSGEAHVLRLPQRMEIKEALEICSRLAAMSDVEYAEPDYIMQPFATPNDPQYTNQWHYLAPAAGHYGVNAPTAWDITTGSASIYAAVIDTGILDHADLSGRWVGGYDFITSTTTANDGDGRDSDPHDPGDWVAYGECGTGSDASDSSWHGTHVAGTIGAATNNSVGVAGLNWVSKVVPLRVLGKCGGITSDIADAMRWSAGLTVTGVPANPYPAKVVNMSLGGGATCSTTYQDAINAMNSAGTVLVVAAGNSNTDASGFTPANCNGVITVAATNRDGGRASYSNYGSVVEVAAPGGETYPTTSNGVLSTLNSGTTSPGSDAYVYYQGTSMAAPHVTGVVSLMFSVTPSLTPTQVLNILQNTVTPFPAGSSCTTSTCGSGIVNARAAVAMAQSVTGPPTVISTNPANGANGVAASTTIKAVFSKPMNAATINATTFTMNNGVTGTVSYDPATYIATFTPSANLALSTTYTATITTGVTDGGGTHMAANKVWSFTTDSARLVFNSSDVPKTINDNSTVNSTLTVPAGACTSITDINVSMNATHTYVGDLSVTLSHSGSGMNVQLYNRSCSSNDNLVAVFDDEAPTAISCPPNGTYQPYSPLSAFDGVDAVGTWTLSVTDNATADTGTLNSWGISVACPSSRQLSVNFPGTGSGYVTINPGNISFNTPYIGQFSNGAILTLTAAAYDYSDFTSFTGSCTTNPCSLTMNGDKSVNANFALDTAHKTRIGASNYFSTLPLAYASPSGTTILAWGTYFAEPLTCNLVKNVTIDGGWNDSYGAKSGYTTLLGPLTISQGSLTVEEVTIK